MSRSHRQLNAFTVLKILAVVCLVGVGLVGFGTYGPGTNPTTSTSAITPIESSSTSTSKATVVGATDARATRDVRTGVLVADTMNRVLGTALSPVFGLGAMGVYDWWTKAESERLWYAEPLFFVPVLLVLLGIVAKDILGVPLGPLKQVFDALEVVVNKVAGCLGLVATMAYTGFTLGPDVADGVSYLFEAVMPVAHAAGTEASGGVMASMGAFFASVIGGIGFAAVWLTGHTYTTVMFLNPISAFDPVIKGARASFIGGVALLTAVFPLIGIGICALYFLFAFLVAGYCLRLGSYGTVMAWDLLVNKGDGEIDAEKGILCFASDGLSEVPVRTLGYLRETDVGVVFSYRPWLILRAQEEAIALERLEGVCAGLIFSTIYTKVGDGETVDLVSLPPRWVGQEDALQSKFDIAGNTQSLLKGGLADGYAFVMSFFRRPPKSAS